MLEVDTLEEQVNQRELRQGNWLSCALLEENIKTHIVDARSDILARELQIECADNIIIVSQDCDIHNANILTIDVLIGKVILNKKAKKANAFHKSRNYQRLVLKIDNGQWWEFHASSLSSVSKELFMDALPLEPDSIKELTDRNKGIVLTWLSSKYIREPFPHCFNLAFLPYIWKNKNKFADLLEEHHDDIIDVYVYVFPESEEFSDSYEVALVLLLDLNCSDEVKEHLEKSLKEHCKFLHQQELEGISKLNMLQVTEEAESVLNNVSYAQWPADFSKEDELSMKSLTLNYLCWPDDEV